MVLSFGKGATLKWFRFGYETRSPREDEEGQFYLTSPVLLSTGLHRISIHKANLESLVEVAI